MENGEFRVDFVHTYYIRAAEVVSPYYPVTTDNVGGDDPSAPL